jgi:Polysaccharide lyase
MKVIIATFILNLLAMPIFGLTATNLAGFEGIEEPVVKYVIAQNKFVPDNFTNITEAGNGIMRMTLRFNHEWWDGDRSSDDTSRQRAEVKGIGPHQLTGDTFEYATTWRTSTNLYGTREFCHVFQLKAINGDHGSPLVTLSILPGTSNCCVQYHSGNTPGFTAARDFHWSPGVWQNVRIRVKTSTTNDGQILVSVNGDDFQGVTNVSVYRPDATEYRPKWGLYRAIDRNLPQGATYVEHKSPSARKL